MTLKPRWPNAVFCDSSFYQAEELKCLTYCELAWISTGVVDVSFPVFKLFTMNNSVKHSRYSLTMATLTSETSLLVRFQPVCFKETWCPVIVLSSFWLLEKKNEDISCSNVLHDLRSELDFRMWVQVSANETVSPYHFIITYKCNSPNEYYTYVFPSIRISFCIALLLHSASLWFKLRK